MVEVRKDESQRGRFSVNFLWISRFGEVMLSCLNIGFTKCDM